MCVGTCMFLQVFIHSHGDQTTMAVGSSILWVLRSNSDPSDLAASAFPLPAIFASRCWAFNMTLLMKSHHNSSPLALLKNDTFSEKDVQATHPAQDPG